MFHLISGGLMVLGSVYLCLRCIVPLSLSRGGRLLLGGLCIVAAFKLQLFRFFFGGSVVQELPFGVLVFAGWLHASVIILLTLSLFMDALRPLRALMNKCTSGWGRYFCAQTSANVRVGRLALVAMLLAGVGVWQAVRVPEVKKIELSVVGLPSDLDGLRLVHLTDLHASPLFRQEWVRAVVERSNALKPDLMVLTGDMVDGSPLLREKDVAPLAHLQARYGVYGCHGNHEYYSNMPAWHAAFEALGLRFLRNEHVVLRIGEANLVLGGITDRSGAGRMGLALPDIGKTFANSPQGWRLLLAHQPADAALHATAGVGLQLSGHTHGGQLFPFSLVAGQINQGYLAGEYSVGRMLLYVSRGAGLWAGFPLRLGAPSEITHITLRRAAAGGGTAH